MDVLVSLINQLRRNKIKNLEIFHHRALQSSGKLGELYQRLYHESMDINPEQVAFDLGFDSDTDSTFKNLKKELKDRLINTLFLVDSAGAKYGHLEGAYMHCWKEWAAAKILFTRGATPAAIDLTRRVFIRAVRYEFTELALNTSRSLRMYYATRGADPRKFNEYDESFSYYRELFEWESLAEGHYTHLMIHFSSSRASKPELSDQALACFEELRPALSKYSAYRLHRYANFIRLIAYMSRHDYETSIQICDEAIAHLREKGFAAKQAISSFLYQKLLCHTKLRQFEAGRHAAEESLTYELPGSYNWFKNRELSLMLAFHSCEYSAAYQIHQQVIQQKNYKKLDRVSRETWTIIQGYLSYLQYIGRIQLPETRKRPKRFRLGKFLNEVPIFSRDKRGMNIPILVLQVLFTISRHQYQEAIDRIEAIEKYCTRYLRRDDTFRSNCFIKMLLQIPIHGFHRKAVERHAAPYLEQLRSMPLSEAPQGPDIELIPYEELWPMVLGSLDVKFYRKRK